jgi:enamine deaminase RidA (YjgF/YER057c/UK114 family)
MIETRNIAMERVVLPTAPEPLGQYSAVSEANGLVFLSGMIPLQAGKVIFTGQQDREKGREAAYLAALNALAVLKKQYGDLKRIKRVVQAAIYIAAAPDFGDHAFVADGCSEILNQVFPDKHSRLAFGVSSLPRNASVELALIFELNGK